jgi:hypothetical protein
MVGCATWNSGSCRKLHVTGFQESIIMFSRKVFLTIAATIAWYNVVDNCSSRRREMRINLGFSHKRLALTAHGCYSCHAIWIHLRGK